MKKIGIIISLFFWIAAVTAQQWEVPADKKVKVAPIQFNTETIKKGEAIYKQNCQMCHGDPTKGNYAKLTPSPGDPASETYQNQTDGSMFYKITTGRGAMPQFKDVLKEEERWLVISYIRSFNKNYIQPSPEGAKSSVELPKVAIEASYSKDSNLLSVWVTDLNKKPIANTEVIVAIKRYFGNLPAGETITTNNKGIAAFSLPKDIPGDKQGNLELIIKLNSEKAGDIQKTITLPIGIPTNKASLTEKRALWNTSGMAPIWLLLTYSIVVIGIWSFIIYIIYKLYILKKSTKK